LINLHGAKIKDKVDVDGEKKWFTGHTEDIEGMSLQFYTIWM
jgi:hypothetical protein